MKKLLFLVIISILINCEEKHPTFYPNLTESSSPKEGVLPYFKGEVMDPYWLETEKLPNDLRKFTKVSLLSNKNNEWNEQGLLGKYKLVIFFYAKCTGICPMITRNMINLLPKIENQSDIQILSITINPDIDSPEILESFRKQYKVTQENWTFLTGSKEAIYELARNQFGADVKTINGKDDLTDFVHTENVYLLDKENYLRGMYRARGTGDLERLLVELKTLRNRDSTPKPSKL